MPIDRISSPDLAWSEVEYYLGERMAASYRLASQSASTGPRAVTYEIGHGGHDIALCVELRRNEVPPRSPLPAVVVDQVALDGLRMARIRTTHVALMRDFHDLIMAIAERVITRGRNVAEAFVETVNAWTSLVEHQRVLGLQRRVGLHGELAVLKAIAATHGWGVALDSWTGPDNEEHDFVLPDFDVEVKTTSAENRHHTVSGFGQLEPSIGRPLWFLSVQLTRGGAGGRTLTESILAVRESLAAEGVELRSRFVRAVAGAGWREGALDDERWMLRNEPLILAADEMPRLRADHVPPSVRDRIRSVRYDIDVTGFDSSSSAPVSLAGFHLP